MLTVTPDRLLGFGATTASELRLRALTGGVVATGLVVGGFCVAGFEWPFLLLLAGCGAAGSWASWSYERRQPSSRPEARYGLVGMVVAAAALVLLARSDLEFVLVGAMVALPLGVAGGAVAGLCAARLPTRLLLPALCLGLAVLTGAAVVAVTRTLPWLSGSYLVAEGPTTARSAERLAAQVAAALRVAPDPLSDSAWEEVASSVVAPREGGSVSIGYERTATSRQITVLVDDQRACVDVRAPRRVSSHTGDCRRR